ncbi:MAG: hypothetical protein LBP78_01985 [Acidaminococcales bacterium]|nr:hypothetical protein [Acidaminococcales bacterium]
MPRPLLRPQEKTNVQQNNMLNATLQQESKIATPKMSQAQIDRLLRKPRSQAYIDALRKLDAGGHVCNHSQVKELIDALKDEFPEIEFSGVLLGIVAACCLGRPYEVHSLDLAGNIVQHYKAGEPLPGALEKARAIAIHGGYLCIEVYTNCCRAIHANGTVSLIK